MKKLLVIDGNSILNRQYYGIRPLTTKSGIHTNAVFGFTKVLSAQLEKLSPDYAAVAFDLKEKTFRHIKYSEYKAGRHATPEELLGQFPYAKRMVRALGMTELSLAGYEADDILGTLSHMASSADEEIHTYILTGDKDSLQLINDKTTVLLAGNHDVMPYGEAEFFERYGVKPTQFVDVKALMGDSSDNIPGVAGIGEKTALKLIAENKTLEKIYSDIDSLSVTATMKAKLSSGRESAFLSQYLARIESAAPLGIVLADIAVKPFNRKELESLFVELEFTSFDKLLEKAENSEEQDFVDTVSGNGTEAEIISAAELCKKHFSEPCALYESDLGVFVADSSSSFLAENARFEELSELFAANPIKYTVFDMKSMLHRLSSLDIEVSFGFDIMLAAYVLDATVGSYDIKRLAVSYASEQFNEKDPASQILKIASAQKQALEKEGVEKLYYEIEHPLARVLFETEKTGFCVDTEMLSSFSATLDAAAVSYMNEIYDIAGTSFNINSPKQLGEVLFERLGLPSVKKSKRGYSTDSEVLEKLRPYSPIIDLITEYRQAVKFKNTYADALAKAADRNGRVHTSFNQTVTATGRLSSTEPNLQNIPVRTELGREFRRAFSAKDGCLLIDADYSQIELRILAAVAEDEIMTEAFKKGVDIHSVTASQVFGVPLELVSGEMRKRAKAVNFGIVYGIAAYSLSQDIGVSMREATQYINSYKEKYKGVDNYLKTTVESAKEAGYVTTMFGRRRYISELRSQKASLRSFGERVAMNSPIQGSAADIIKLAMINVERSLKKAGLKARLVLQVHDELIIEADENEVERASEILKYEMENAVALSVPLTVDIGIGKTWYDCK